MTSSISRNRFLWNIDEILLEGIVLLDNYKSAVSIITRF